MALGTTISVTDAQIHIWGAETADRPWPKDHGAPSRPTPFTAGDAIAAMDGAGVARSVLIPPSWEGDRNDLVLQAAKEHPGRFGVMGRIDIEAPSDTDLQTWRQTPGMLGIRVSHRLLFSEGFADWVWDSAARAQIPVMLFVPRQISGIARIARAFPDLRLIIDHLNLASDTAPNEVAPSIEKLLTLANFPNVAVKVTAFPARVAEPYPFPTFHASFRRVVDAFGADRCMWGSDLTSLPCPYLDWVRAITEAADYLSASEKAFVMGGTLSNWLNWPDPTG